MPQSCAKIPINQPAWVWEQAPPALRPLQGALLFVPDGGDSSRRQHRTLRSPPAPVLPALQPRSIWRQAEGARMGLYEPRQAAIPGRSAAQTGFVPQRPKPRPPHRQGGTPARPGLHAGVPPRKCRPHPVTGWEGLLMLRSPLGWPLSMQTKQD